MTVTVRGQFQRSVQLVRDFYGTRGLEGYVVTSRAAETTGRLVEALETPGSPRAWAVAGPYGGGKSSYALFASRLLRGDGDARAHLAATDPALADRVAAATPGAFCPVLVVGSRGPVVGALAEALGRSLDAWAATVPAGAGSTKGVASRAAALAGQARLATTEAEVVEAVDAAAELVHERTGGGLLVVVDELGKHLEYAALHPAEGDLFVLQSLAERAATPGAAPLLVVTVLHQAFERYAVGLSSAQRADWQKVQGRFEDVAYVEPVGETLRLLAAAVDAELSNDERAAGAEAVRQTVRAAVLPARLDADAVAERLAQALPLHPAVALLVGPLFRRLAQNERSLFSFLASGEPFSFLDVSGGGETYRLDHLYDYLTATLGGALYHDGAGRLWAETEAARSRLAGDPLQERMLKQVAVLSFAGALAGLPPSEAVLRACSGVLPDETDAALDALLLSRAVAFRPFHREYRVWEGSDFDLAGALARARAEVPDRTPLADLLAAAAPPAPLVARRHAFETGTTRVFEVSYTDADGWRSLLAETPDDADGRVVYVLPDDAAPGLAEAVTGASAGAAGPVLVCLPDGVAGLRELARDLACLDWVQGHEPALEGDAAARREVAEQRADLAAALGHRLANALGTDAGTWIASGAPADVSRGLQPALSDLADRAFSQTPRVWNELLNRRRPSSSAVRAQKLLLQAMAEHERQPRLGIGGTPAEYALYASVLRETGLHQEVEPGVWAFVDPDDDALAQPVEPGTAAVVRTLAQAIGAARTAPVAVPDLYAGLQAAPFGVREGLLPVFLFAVLARLGDRVAVFEDGAYQWSLSYEAVERMLRGPAAFAVQSVEASPAQRAALDALATRVGVTGETVRPLAVVGRVLQSVAGLPAYVRRTTTLSDAATAVREALVGATEPAALLFRDLPMALGLETFGDEATDQPTPDAGAADVDRQPADALPAEADQFADALADALRELGAAYDALLVDLDGELRVAFDLRGPTPDARRDELAARARALGDVVDASLRSFVVRAADDLADTRAWTESLAALLARTPPAQWADGDRRRFSAALADLARTFRRREAVTFSADAPGALPRDATRFRLSVTATHEHERETVVEVHPEDAQVVEAVEARLREGLAAGGESLDTHLAALSRLSLSLLRQRAAPDAAPSPPADSGP